LIFICPKYLAYVRAHPCVICGIDECVDAHHARSTGLSFGMKPPDFLAFPLCRLHHGELHDIGHKTWAKRYGQPESWYVNRMLMKAIADGVLVFKAT